MPKAHRKGPSISKKSPNDTKKPTTKSTTSWGGVASWYDNHLEETKDTYQEKVIAPNLVRILNIQKGTKIIDIACGQGFFSRKFAELGADVIGADISKELIDSAKKRSPNIKFYATPAHRLSFAKDGTFDSATIILAIQNIENMQEVLAEARRVLKPAGKLSIVLNHPAFRIPKRSSWAYDEHTTTQYRRIDRYMSTEKSSILMHPGTSKSETISYHRSLQDFFKAFAKAGFFVTRLEEWISDKKSGAGPKQKAEDTARKEIPLFMMLECEAR